MATFKSVKHGVTLGRPRFAFIRKRQPWIWKFFFPNVPFKNTAFTWGNTVYTDLDLSPDLIAHENVHIKQQRYSRVFGFFCILLYKFCRPYRRKCEIEAYTKQALFLKKEGKPYMQLAQHMGSPLYGIMTVEEAKAVLHLKCESLA